MNVRSGLLLASAFALAELASAAAFGQDSASCDRACLENWVDRYLDAVVDNNPAGVPLARNVRFTENGQRLEIGDGLWHSMKSKGTYRLFVADVPRQRIGFLGTISEDGRTADMDAPAVIALRLKIDGGRISEVEQMVVRNADAAQRIEARGEPRAAFTTAVPAAQRMTRAELIATANKYFSGMQQIDGKGDYPFADDCNRIENGGQSTNVATPAGEARPDPATATNYSSQWSCREQFESGLLHFVTRIRDRRFVAVDEERGIVFSYVFFDHSAGETRNFMTPDGRHVTAGPAQPWTWHIAEIFKVANGRLHEIEAVLDRVPYGMNSGWSSYEDGMSDRAQDATR